MNENCAYCMEGELVNMFGIKIGELESSKVYLFREQSHPGRVIVAHKKHVSEITDLTKEERALYMEDIAKVGHHLHFHLVPKYEDSYEWGGTFAMNPEQVTLTDEKYEEMVRKYQEELNL